MSIAARPRLVALDWGTTSCRAHLIGDGGAVLSRRADGLGTLAAADLDAAPAVGFARELARLCGDWLEQWPALPLIASGMVGSAQGWVEAPYLQIPSPLGDLGGSLTEIATPLGTLHVVPGLATERGVVGLPEVMRGEETQLVGALPGLAGEERPGASRVVLPGTHTKWVGTEGGTEGDTVTGFATTMGGEMFALLLDHGILGRLAARGTDDDAAFRRGLDVALGTPPAWGEPPQPGRPLATTLFSARSLVLAADLAPHAVPDYLSGLLIGSEVAALADWLDPGVAGAEPVLVVGADALVRRYRAALGHVGLPTRAAPSDAAARGLWRIAVTAGLVEGDPDATAR